MLRKLCFAAFLLGAASGVAYAQTSGSITGEVTDASGAVVPDAAVTVSNMQTNVARQTVTNSSGLYSVPEVPPGLYSVKVVVQGFDTVVKNNIEIQVQQTARVDFALNLGHATQTVEVAANAAQLNTENATVGTVIEQARISELPLNGRSFFSLVALSPNVTYGFVAAAQASGRLGGSRGSLTIAVSGSRATWENYTLDGVTNTDIDFNTYIIQPSVDALQEFKVQTGMYPAEFGREAGQVNVSTKSGTNNYHGTMLEFLRNSELDAKDYDFNSASRSATNPSPGKAPYRQNQYGYTLTGPDSIPKLFNGKNKLFFMSNYRRVQIAQDDYFARHGAYAGDAQRATSPPSCRSIRWRTRTRARERIRTSRRRCFPTIRFRRAGLSAGSITSAEVHASTESTERAGIAA